MKRRKEQSFFESSRIIYLFFFMILLYFLIWIDLTFYNSIVQYALESLKGDCDMPNATNEQLSAAGYIGYYSACTDTIVTLSNTNNPNLSVMTQEQYNTFLVHEMCHAEQYKQGRMYNCNFRFGVLLNEMECYWKQGNFWYYLKNE